MKQVLVIGSPERLEEFKEGVQLQNAEVTYSEEYVLDPAMGFLGDEFLPEYDVDIDLDEYDIVFDLNMDEFPENLDAYLGQTDLVVIGCAVKNSLAMMVRDLGEDPDFSLFGMNALPTFISRNVMEVSMLEEDQFEELDDIMKELGLAYQVVEDRVGMVTPRIICMIINEASYVLQEGTAGIDAVDQAMKLGTNYPFGPFEWADNIGVQNVFEVLHSLQQDTGEEKYKISARLKRIYLREKSFRPQ